MNTGIDRALSMKLDPISVSPMDHEKMMMNITRKNQKLHLKKKNRKLFQRVSNQTNLN